MVLFKSLMHEFKEYTNEDFEFVFISAACVSEIKANKLIAKIHAVKT
jgi:hypothetical protein